MTSHHDTGYKPRRHWSIMRVLVNSLAWWAAALALSLCVPTRAAATELAATTLARAKSRFAELGANKVHYVVLGQGAPTLVFVHCWTGNLAFWRFQLAALRERSRLILIDLPGHGQSDAPQTACTMEWYARALAAVLRHAKVDRAVLVGHSMGVNVISQAYVRKLAPQLDYRTIPGTGHFLMQEKPEAVNTALLEFLRQYRFVTK